MVEALVLALPRRGSVEVITRSAEEVSTSEVVTAEAAGCVDCGSRDSSRAPPESSVCGTTGRATIDGESWKSVVAGSGEKSGRPADPSSADIENVVSGVVERAGAAVVTRGAGVTAKLRCCNTLKSRLLRGESGVRVKL